MDDNDEVMEVTTFWEDFHERCHKVESHSDVLKFLYVPQVEILA